MNTLVVTLTDDITGIASTQTADFFVDGITIVDPGDQLAIVNRPI